MAPSLRPTIEALVPLKNEEWQMIDARFFPVSLRAGELLLKPGEVCGHLYFAETGLLRFYEWTQEAEKTKFFAGPGEVFTSQLSFSQQIPSREYLEALLPTRLLAITYADLQQLYEQIPAWSRFIRLVIQEVNGWMEKLLVESQTLTAEARYLQLIEQENSWVRDVPLKHLASYLGIAPESLSRIRKKIWQQART